jgi:hypothetical protein
MNPAGSPLDCVVSLNLRFVTEDEMKSIKKLFIILIAALLLFTAFACDKGGDSGNGGGGDGETVVDRDTELKGFFGGYGTVPDEGKTAQQYGGEVTASRIATDLASGKTYVEVDGAPFLYIGASIRTDAFMNTDLYTYAELERLFAEAAALGVTCVQVPVEWKDIEPEEGKFDFSYVHSVLTFCNRYGLKIELLWFGTNMCGDSHSYSVPDYIIRDGKTYPKLDARRTGEFWSYYGIMWYMDFNNPALMAKESAAAKAVMDYVWEWDGTHGAKKTVIGMQINNETDGFARWRLDAYGVIDPDTGKVMTAAAAFKKINDSMDAVGKAVKSAKYKVFTRANLTLSTGGAVYDGNGFGMDNVLGLPGFVGDVFGLDGIDAVGDDSYLSDLRSIKGIAYMFGKKTPGNFAHFAENGGHYSSTPGLILSALAMGAGYSIYDLVSSPFFVNDLTTPAENMGIIRANPDRVTFTYAAHYESAKAVIAGLKKAWTAATLAPMEDFAVFNCGNNTPDQSVTNKRIDTSEVRLEFSTSQKSLGFGIVYGGHIYLYATESASVTVSQCTPGAVESGAFEAGVWRKDADESATGGAIGLTAGKLYRAAYTGGGGLTSTVWDNIGA